MLHRPLIDAIEFARAGSKLSGEWPVADLPRIEGGEHPDHGVLHYKLQGVPLEQGRPALRLRVTGVLNLTCQRCLGALEHFLQVDALLLLYASERDIAEGPVESEGPDRIVASQDLAVRDLIEDEVLLALPYVPRHERCEARPRHEAAPRQRPFADLRALLDTKHQDAFQQDDAGHPARRMIFNKEPTMAVPQNRKTPSKRGMHRSHDALSGPPLAVEPTTGEVHLRHHISPTGYYRGKKVAKGKGD